MMGRKSNASQRRDQIVWALYDCLVEKGSEKVTIKEIAARAKLPPGVIHYYFTSKDQIVSNLAEAIVDKYSRMLDRRIAEATSVTQRIDFAIDFIVDTLVFNPPLNRVFYNLIQMSFEREALGDVIKKMLSEYRQRLAQVFKEAGADRESKMIGAALVAITEGFSLQLVVDSSIFKRNDVRRLVAQTVRAYQTNLPDFKKSA